MRSKTPLGLAKTLETAIIKKVTSKVKELAEERRQKTVAEAYEWKLDVKGWLSKTRSGDTPGSQGNNAPFKVTGQISQAVGYRTSRLKVKKGANGLKTYFFTVGVRFKEVFSYNTKTHKKRPNATDYSDALNDSRGTYYSNYKDRAKDELFKRVGQIVNGRSITNDLHRSKGF